MAGRRKHSFYQFCKRIRLAAYIQQICTFFIIASLVMIIACTGSFMGRKQDSGVYHRVRKGETLYKIAQLYGVSLQHLAEVNNIDHTEILEVGQVLFIPDVQAVADDILVAVKKQEAVRNFSKRPVIVSKKPPPRGAEGALAPGSDRAVTKLPLSRQSSKGKDQSPSSSEDKSAIASQRDKTMFPLKLPSALRTESNDDEKALSNAEEVKIQRENRLFLWPVVGKVVSRYGIQPNGMFYNGIKIAAPEGTPVIAAADGVVIFSAPLKDYGETIILKHDNDYASVYTLLGQRLVKREDRIKKGDKIATVARSAIKGESLLNFEIRYKNRARNPLFFLP